MTNPEKCVIIKCKAHFGGIKGVPAGRRGIPFFRIRKLIGVVKYGIFRKSPLKAGKL